MQRNKYKRLGYLRNNLFVLILFFLLPLWHYGFKNNVFNTFLPNNVKEKNQHQTLKCPNVMCCVESYTQETELLISDLCIGHWALSHCPESISPHPGLGHGTTINVH